MTIAFRIVLFMVMAVAVLPAPIKALKSRKLDDTTPNDEIKCGGCPCGEPCYSSPPPPPPTPSPPPPPTPSPPPPTPSPPPPTPSPPPPHKPSPFPGVYCPPPPHKKPPPTPGLNYPPPPSGGGGEAPQPTPDYISITGPPGDIYPVEESISSARRSFTVAPSLLVVSGLLGMIAFW